jgi:hypothetical protein
MDLENANDFPAAKSVSWMTEEQGQAIKDFVSGGGGFIHCTMPAISRSPARTIAM